MVSSKQESQRGPFSVDLSSSRPFHEEMFADIVVDLRRSRQTLLCTEEKRILSNCHGIYPADMKFLHIFQTRFLFTPA